MNNSERSKEIAVTILQQLGGMGRLKAMVNIKNITLVENGVLFKMPVAGAKANFVKVVLNSMDTYDLTLTKVHGKSIKVVAEHPGIYDTMLKGLIEKGSELRLSF